MLKLSLLILFFFCAFQSFAQRDSLIDSIINKKAPIQNAASQTAHVKKDTVNAKNIFSVTIIDSGTKNVASNLYGKDSSGVDSIKGMTKDSIAHTVKVLTWHADTAFTGMFNPFLKNGKATPFFMIEEERKTQNKDELFYLLAGLVAFLAFIKVSFPKYFQNIFRLFFQSSFRQKQKRENLLQDNLPSLLLNLLFILSGGLFITLFAVNRNWIHINFWLLFLDCTLLLAIIYSGKFVFISFAGWVFRAREASGSYIFIVFLINKIAGIILTPLLFLFAFSGGEIANTSITIALVICFLLLLYRYILLLSFVRRNLKVNPIHFFIYLCCIEIMPMLVIYKVLFNKIGQTF